MCHCVFRAWTETTVLNTNQGWSLGSGDRGHDNGQPRYDSQDTRDSSTKWWFSGYRTPWQKLLQLWPRGTCSWMWEARKSSDWKWNQNKTFNESSLGVTTTYVVLFDFTWSEHTTCIVHAVRPRSGTKHFLKYLSSKSRLLCVMKGSIFTALPTLWLLFKRQWFNYRKARLYSYCPHPSPVHQVNVSLTGWSYSVWSLKLLLELPSWVSQINKF